MSAEEAKRRYIRYACDIPAEMVTAPNIPSLRGKIVDLGKQGCLLAMHGKADLDTGAKVILIFKLNRTQVKIRGIVRSIREENGVGIEFDRMSAEVGRQLGTLAPAKTYGYEFRDGDRADPDQDVRWIEGEVQEKL